MPKFEAPDLELLKPIYPNFDLLELDFESIDIKESSGMNELIQITIEKHNEVINKQTEMIDKQSETINQISALVGKQQEMINDGRKDSRETRFFSIFSNLLAIIAIVISIVLR